jgi:hypothetical protein
MRGVWTMPFAIAVLFLAADYPAARAVPVSAQPLNVAAPTDVQLAQVRRGPRGGVAARGPRGGVAVRGPRGRAAVRGPRGNVAVRGGYRGGVYRGGVRRGAYRVGGRYYGGVWYGTGRRYWRGRWWPYGVGSCWRNTPIGFVWVCG